MKTHPLGPKVVVATHLSATSLPVPQLCKKESHKELDLYREGVEYLQSELFKLNLLSKELLYLYL